MIEQGSRALITFDDWFIAPDSRQYRSAWGRVWYHQAKELFGFDPKAGANFYLQVGEGDGALLAAGCRVHYAARSDSPPTVVADVYIPASEQSA